MIQTQREVEHVELDLDSDVSKYAVPLCHVSSILPSRTHPSRGHPIERVLNGNAICHSTPFFESCQVNASVLLDVDEEMIMSARGPGTPRPSTATGYVTIRSQLSQLPFPTTRRSWALGVSFTLAGHELWYPLSQKYPDASTRHLERRSPSRNGFSRATLCFLWIESFAFFLWSFLDVNPSHLAPLACPCVNRRTAIITISANPTWEIITG
ncbi:hypothetical protein FB451DRAFT_79241 [Mycena latifolia]|nr:hypothetical protein FB451DRAFT_79241 [Mycena latifolia]